jgi:anti-anti-sigma regulatory factor
VPKASAHKSRQTRKSAESPGDPNATDGAIALAAVADMEAACDLVEALRDALEQQVPVVIDATAVEDMSTPYAQALVSAATSFAAANVTMVFRQPSDAFIAAFNRTGLYAAMMQWSFVE